MSVPDFPFFHGIFFLRETRIFYFLLFCGRVREERREIRGFRSSSKTQMSGVFWACCLEVFVYGK